MKNCCFTGHRPKFFPWGNNADDVRARELLSAIENEIRLAIEDDYRDFLWGGALGVDMWAAECVLGLKQEYPHITLTAVLPFEGYNDFVTDTAYRSAINDSDFRVFTGKKRGIAGFTERDLYMIDRSGRIIAVYDERSGIRSGTYRALRYAKEKRIEVRQIFWMDYC